jgi:type IV pilus assembly protein PilA
VVVVLGVLAAIAVPVLLQQKDKASRAAATSDLRAVRASQAMWLADDNDSYTNDLDELAAMGYRPSDGVEPPVIKLTGTQYLACVRHRSMSDWLVFHSGSGETTRSSQNACA